MLFGLEVDEFFRRKVCKVFGRGAVFSFMRVAGVLAPPSDIPLVPVPDVPLASNVLDNDKVLLGLPVSRSTALETCQLTSFCSASLQARTVIPGTAFCTIL